MNKILVAVFDNEEAAFSGLSGLKNLHRNGDITLYNSAVIAKDKFGNTVVKQEPDNQPVGTFIGLFLGALVGVLGGPVGVAIGASTGTLMGLTRDAVSAGVDYRFLDQVREAITPGKFAVIAEVDESWVAPVDLTIGECGGMVFRRLRHEVVEDQLERESSEFEAELKELENELSRTTGTAKASIQARIALVHKSLDEVQREALSRAETVKAEWRVKLHTMDKQLADANNRGRERIQHQIEKAKTEFNARMAKLSQAQGLIAEALKP